MEQLTFGRVFEQALKLPRAIRRLGVPATTTLVRSHLAHYAARLSRGPGSREKPLRRVRPRGCASPIVFRMNTSDIKVVQQVFLRGEYDCVGAEPDPMFIVDCGANIGCASVYFLNRYPKARVVAIEADAANYEVCRTNLEPYGDRARAIHGGVWPRSEALVVDRGDGAPGGEWAFRVRPCREGEAAEIQGIGLAELVEASPGGRIDILKIDIEGGEEDLFAADVGPWLSRTGAVVIELHGPSCERVVEAAVEPFGFRLEPRGPVSVARRPNASRAPRPDEETAPIPAGGVGP